MNVDNIIVPSSLIKLLGRNKNKEYDKMILYKKFSDLLEYGLLKDDAEHNVVLIDEEKLLSNSLSSLMKVFTRSFTIVLSSCILEKDIDFRNVLSSTIQRIIILEPRDVSTLVETTAVGLEIIRRYKIPVTMYVSTEMLSYYLPTDLKEVLSRTETFLKNIPWPKGFIKKIDTQNIVKALSRVETFFRMEPGEKRVIVLSLGYASMVVRETIRREKIHSEPILVEIGISYPLPQDLLKTIIRNEPIEIILVDFKGNFLTSKLKDELNKLYLEGDIDYIPQIFYLNENVLGKIFDKEVRHILKKVLKKRNELENFVYNLEQVFKRHIASPIPAVVNLLRRSGIEKIYVYSGINSGRSVANIESLLGEKLGVQVQGSPLIKLPGEKELLIGDIELFESANFLCEFLKDKKRCRGFCLFIYDVNENSDKVDFYARLLENEGFDVSILKEVSQLSALTKTDAKGLQIFIVPTQFLKSDKIAIIDPKMCSGCGLCLSETNCSAIKVDLNGRFFIDPTECYGCGLCELYCEKKAIIRGKIRSDFEE